MTKAVDKSSGCSGASGELLRVQLTITPHPESHCVLVNEAADTEDLTHNFKSGEQDVGDQSSEMEDGFACGHCHTVLTETDTQDQKYLRSEANTNCICPVFEDNDCVSEVRRVKSGSLVIVVTVQNRNELRQLIKDLRTVDATLSVDWLVKGGEGRSTTEIDVNSITTKQQEALETAIDEGYYETPRETNLEDLADELNISESAASQRLNTAEMKLVKSFMNE